MDSNIQRAEVVMKSVMHATQHVLKPVLYSVLNSVFNSVLTPLLTRVQQHTAIADVRSFCLPMTLGAIFCLPVQAQAQDLLRVAGFETLSDPLIVFDKQHHVVGGLLKDYTDAIARGLDAKPVYIPYSRRRIEPAIKSGEADLVCYHSPKWVDHPADFAWTIPNLPQTERVVVRKDTPVPHELPEDLSGKKIATQIGYHYALIEPDLAAGRTTRIDMTDVPSMFRLLALGGADALITSESEIAGYFKKFPDKHASFSVSKTAFSVVYTQCALSLKSPWKIEQINRIVLRLQENGTQDKLMRKYGLSEK